MGSGAVDKYMRCNVEGLCSCDKMQSAEISAFSMAVVAICHSNLQSCYAVVGGCLSSKLFLKGYFTQKIRFCIIILYYFSPSCRSQNENF